MDRVTLISGPPTLALVRQDQGVFAEIEGAEGQATAKFPVKASLLKAVVEGYSYQIANEYGSLGFSLAEGDVDARFDGKTGNHIRARLQKQEFFEAVSNLHVDNV